MWLPVVVLVGAGLNVNPLKILSPVAGDGDTLTGSEEGS